MAIKTKICGLTSKESIKSAIENGADYVGFVFFHKSPRVITARNAAKLAAVLPDNIKTVAVVVDITDAELEDILSYFKPDFIQCHGKETTERIIEIREKFGIKVIKAISVRSSDDIAKGKSFSDIADMILFDAKVPSSPLPGGNGLAFDWTLLRGREFNIPWFLSGGLNIENVTEAVKITGAKAVDVSSSIESEPGKKDPDLISAFLKKVKSIK